MFGMVTEMNSFGSAVAHLRDLFFFRVTFEVNVLYLLIL
jgi:hypothetical protein